MSHVKIIKMTKDKREVNVKLLVRLEGVGHMAGRSTTVMWHTAYEDNAERMRGTLTDALNKLRAKGREDDVLVLQGYFEVRWMGVFPVRGRCALIGVQLRYLLGMLHFLRQ